VCQRVCGELIDVVSRENKHWATIHMSPMPTSACVNMEDAGISCWWEMLWQPASTPGLATTWGNYVVAPLRRKHCQPAIASCDAITRIKPIALLDTRLVAAAPPVPAALPPGSSAWRPGTAGRSLACEGNGGAFWLFASWLDLCTPPHCNNMQVICPVDV